MKQRLRRAAPRVTSLRMTGGLSSRVELNLRNLRIILWLAVVAAGLAWLGLASRREQAPPLAAPVLTSGSLRPVFALPDAQGRLHDSAEFRGRHQLVFFGFTNCPDVCPVTLVEVAEVMDGLGAKAERVQPIFISIDPERDRRLGLDAYTTAFHPAILGLAGDAAQTRAAAESFKIFYERDEEEAAPDGYLMSHSPDLYLIGPDGEWLKRYEYGTPAAEILRDLQGRL